MGAIVGFIQAYTCDPAFLHPGELCHHPGYKCWKYPGYKCWEYPSTGTTRRELALEGDVELSLKSLGATQTQQGWNPGVWNKLFRSSHKLGLSQVNILRAVSRAGICYSTCEPHELGSAHVQGFGNAAALLSVLISVPLHSFFPFCLISKFHYLASQFFLWAIRIAWLYSWQSP